MIKDKNPQYYLMLEFKRIIDSCFNLKTVSDFWDVSESVSFIVISSLACEIGLKGYLSAHITCTDIYPGNIADNTHNLQILFHKLNPLEQKTIIDTVNGKENVNNEGAFQKSLSLVKNNFTDWRYYYETADKKGNEKRYTTNVLFLYSFLNAIIALWDNDCDNNYHWNGN